MDVPGLACKYSLSEVRNVRSVTALKMVQQAEIIIAGRLSENSFVARASENFSGKAVRPKAPEA